jgi:uncharacterized protein with GYD domain
MEHAMATFIVLASFTDQGIRNVKETIGRAEAFKEMAKKSGVAVKDLYWTLGTYDVVAVCESPDDESATALERLLARQRPLRDCASVLLGGDEAHPRQDGLGQGLADLTKCDSDAS